MSKRTLKSRAQELLTFAGKLAETPGLTWVEANNALYGPGGPFAWLFGESKDRLAFGKLPESRCIDELIDCEDPEAVCCVANLLVDNAVRFTSNEAEQIVTPKREQHLFDCLRNPSSEVTHAIDMLTDQGDFTRHGSAGLFRDLSPFRPRRSAETASQGCRPSLAEGWRANRLDARDSLWLAQIPAREGRG
jgi:hypothetical protein